MWGRTAKIWKIVLLLFLATFLWIYTAVDQNMRRQSSTPIDELNNHKMLQNSKSRCQCPGKIPGSEKSEMMTSCHWTTSKKDGDAELKSKCNFRTINLSPPFLDTGQKVLSFSLYHDVDPVLATFFPEGNEIIFSRYVKGIQGNWETMRKFYPGWVMRIYSNVDLDPMGELCKIVCTYPQLYFYSVGNFSIFGRRLEELDPRTWRYLPLGDPTVSKFLSRDLDSRLGSRERAVVRDWENSTMTFHMMRDHSYHNSKIMAGMWGCDNDKLGRETAREIRRQLVNQTYNFNESVYGDQDLVASVIYDKYPDLFLVHDSFYCEKYKDSRPFPVERSNPMDFVGARTGENLTVIHECPKACRPPNFQEWTFC